MDPVTVMGVVTASMQIAQFIGSTIQGLNTLKGKFRDADTTIRLLIGQLSTIRAAIQQIRDWAEYNFYDSPKERRFLYGLHVSLDGCQAAMDVLLEEVKDLMQGAESHTGEGPFTLGMRGRAQAIWNEDSMKTHQDRLHGQVQALQLLLLAGQCRDVVSQSNLLGLKENQRLIQNVADDTRTLRESHSSVASQSTRRSVASGSIFDLDEALAETLPYRTAAARRNTTQNNTRARVIARKPIPSAASRNDEGYETGSPRFEPRFPDLSRRASTSTAMDTPSYHGHHSLVPDADNPAIPRSHSVASTLTAGPVIRRWVSSSSSADSPPPADRISDLGKSKVWKQRLARLNTLSASRLPSTSQQTYSAGTVARPRRATDENINQSIDFTSAAGLETPALVRVAQAGNTVEVERLLENGDYIEARHTPSQRTALSVAAHCGIAEVVELLIRNHAKIDTRDLNLSTPLHLAASRGHCKVLTLLINENVDMEATDRNNQTPLWIAADNGHLKTVDMLLRRGAKINARANDQLTALHAATKQGDKEMIELLLRNNAQIEARDGNSMTALHYASEIGYYHIADFLLQKGAIIETPGKNSATPLICAAAFGHYQVVELLTKKKASPKSLDDKKANALHWAARNGHLEVAEYLLRGKISIHDTDINGSTPLHLAVVGSHFAVVDFLLQKNASVDIPCRNGLTPLHYACSSYNADIVRLLLSAGALAEAPVPGDGRRPIHIAAANGSVDIVEILHDKNVNISTRDAAGDRPLCIACHNGHVEVVQKLLEYGEPLRMPFKNHPSEDSALCIAARAGHLDVVQLLIRKGASVKQRDEYGYIPLRYAAFYGHPELLQFLLREGAELVDDGGDSNGWGFVLMPDMIGFADDVSDERKRRVRELLDGAARHLDGDTNLGFGRRRESTRGSVRRSPGNSLGRLELADSSYGGVASYGGVELSGGTHSPVDYISRAGAESPPPSYVDSPSHSYPQEKQQQQPYHLPQQYGTIHARGYFAPATRSTAVTSYPSPEYAANSGVQDSLTSYAPTPPPNDAARSIASMQAEIERLRQFVLIGETSGQSSGPALHDGIFEMGYENAED